MTYETRACLISAAIVRVIELPREGRSRAMVPRWLSTETLISLYISLPLVDDNEILGVNRNSFNWTHIFCWSERNLITWKCKWTASKSIFFVAVISRKMEQEEGEARQPEEETTEVGEQRQHLLRRVYEVLEEAERGGELEAVYRNQVRNVYIFGSRVHGTHRPDADYDLIALVDGPYYEGVLPHLLLLLQRMIWTSKTGPKLIEREDINVNLYHHAYFLLMLKECLIWCRLTLDHFFPPHNRLLRTFLLLLSWLQVFVGPIHTQTICPQRGGHLGVADAQA